MLKSRPDGLAAAFEPRRVALVGASEQPGKHGSLFWDNLAAFPGEVVPVTSSAASVAGCKAYPTLVDVPGEIDLAVVVVPAARVPDVVRDAAAKGVPAVVVVSGGFAEVGPPGRALQDELVAAARAGGVRVIGPNCFGIQNCDLPLNASMATGTPVGGGGLSVVTQSGAYGMAFLALATDEQVRLAKVCAVGNKADVGDAELLTYLGEDERTRTICYFAESLPDGRSFFDSACSVTPRKPVILAKTGRSSAGARAAQSHTAGLASSERIWRAALERAGVLLARSGLEMMDAARALDSQPPPDGPRMGIVTNSGGTGVELADLLSDEGLVVPELSAPVQEALRSVLPAYASARNPVDMTPVWSRFVELYPLLIERLARSGEVDAVVAVLLHRSAADAQVAVAVRDVAVRLRADGVQVPVYVCWVAQRQWRSNADVLQAAGVPCFEWPERTARAVGHAVRYGSVRGTPREPAQVPPRPSGLPEFGAGWLPPDAGREVLDSAEIAAVSSVLCASDEEAASAAVSFPAVAKVVHPNLLHKSAAGGVRTGLPDRAALRAAAAQLLALAPGAQVLVQPQVSGVEIHVGGLRDPQFGPFVMVGLGGVFVDVLDDVVLGPAPLHRADAHALLGRLRGSRVLGGPDVDALASVLCRVGDLIAAVPEIAELDLNPVLVSAGAAVAVDWRIRVNLPSQDEAAEPVSPSHAGVSGPVSP